MKIYKLKNYTRGWIIGDFTPTIVPTKAFEFVVKNYKAGDKEDTHFHKIATEITVIVSGEFKMNGKLLKRGDIIVMNPGDIARFSCIKTGATTGVKIPSVIGDKYAV